VREKHAVIAVHRDQYAVRLMYAGGAYRALLAAHAFTGSMSRKGDCWDNAAAESFFATLEHELLTDADFASRQVARRAIFEFIEVWYNRERRHSSLGYVSPVEYEQQQGAA
jgi:putative transposase